MLLDITQFSNIAIYKFLFLVLIIFIFFRVIRFFIPFIVKIKKREKINKIVLIIEIVSWLIYLFWAIQYFLIKNQLFAIGMFVVLIISLLWLIWFFIRDYIAGISFRMNKNISLNKHIQINDIAGRITAFQNKYLEIETIKNEKIYIPYLKLSKEIYRISEFIEKEADFNNNFRILVSKKENIKDTINKIRTNIIQLPWNSINKEPKIIPITEEKNGIMLDITVFSIDEEYLFKMKNHIIKNYELKL